LDNPRNNPQRVQAPALTCRNLCFHYGEDKTPILRDLTFAVEEKEVVILTGRSGCGKSTLAYCLAGLYPEYAGILTGEIRAGGTDIATLPHNERARRVSIMFQNPDSQFCMGRVDHEILFALENIAYEGDMRERMRRLLSLIDLEDCETARLHTLSGGTKQKVALATALATGAKILILDEPFANIDPDASAELARKLRALNEDGLTLFVVDHRLDYWKPFLTRTIELSATGGIADAKARIWNFEGCSPVPPPSPPEIAVSIRDLSVSYDKKTVLSSLSMDIEQGTLTALIGKNGSGKSTLLMAIAGLLRFKGKIDSVGSVGLVFQNPRYQFLALNVREDICISLKRVRSDVPKEAIEREADRLLDEFGLLPYAEASPYALSQGQQRRLAILSMLAGDRPILLLDEPTYAQDEQATHFIMELLQRRIAAGLTAVVATHDLKLAEAFANRIISMEER
jgi:energy-coupling factor transport system ATP-binding protein